MKKTTIFKTLLFLGLFLPFKGICCHIVVDSVSATKGCVPLTVYMRIINDEGKKISSVKWDFGDGGTNSHPSSDSFLTYTYTEASKDTTKDYKPKATITFSDGTTCSATYDSVIKVWSPPSAKIDPIVNATQCIKSNRYCFSQSSMKSKNNKPCEKQGLLVV